MRVTRKLEGIQRELMLLAKQGKVEGFFNNIKNADKLVSLVEDIRDAMMDYQVHMLYCPFIPCLIFVLDLIATRYLQ